MQLYMQCELDTRKVTYDKSRADQIAINCNPSRSTDGVFQRCLQAAAIAKNNEFLMTFLNKFSNMNYQVLENANAGGLHVGCYAAGMFKNSKCII